MQAPKKFKTKQFLIEMFGSPQGLLSFVRAYGITPPGTFAVEKWFARESIPHSWLAILVVHLEVDRGAVSSVLSPYVEGE